MITSISQLDLNKHYTYADYLLWQFTERVELFKGKLLQMTGPNVLHQTISSNLHIRLGVQLLDRKCKLFAAPFDVRLPLPPHKKTNDKIDTVIQPDLCVICDDTKLDEQGCIGAPDLIVEILSPGNSKREMKDKFELYQEAGVLEYWVISPQHRSVFVHVMNQNTKKFVAQLPHLTDEDVLLCKTLGSLAIELKDVFPVE